MDKTGRIRDHFNEEADEYGELVERLIPKYREQHCVILELIPRERSDAVSILDVGCGTGTLSRVILENFPNARVVAIDMAEKMLEVCESALAEYDDRLTLRQADFSQADIGSGYDIVLSGLAVHHLTDQGKRRLFKCIFESLNPGGAFLNRDIVLGATPALTGDYERIWRAFMRSNGENDEKWFAKHLEEDAPATIENQLKWLSEAGFVDVGCHWQYFNFAVFGGKKPSD